MSSSPRVTPGDPGAVPRPRVQPAGSIPASSESTSASQLASMMFSETPIAPHVSCPSQASSSTRVTAPVPLRLVEDADLEVDELDVAQVRIASRRSPSAARCRAR